MVDGDIDVENVAVFEYSLVRDAVANDLVQRRAYGLGEVAVVEGRWVRLLRLTRLSDSLILSLLRHARQ